MSLPAILPLHHDPAYPPAPAPGGGGPPIFQPLPTTDIGFVYRGDTVVLPPWVAVDYYGETVDLTGATVWFTAKLDLDQEDNETDVIQRSTANGGVVVLDPPTEGLFQATIDPASTQGLFDDTVFIWDAQVRTGEAQPRTITVRRGIMTVIRDVTRTPA